MNLEEQHTGEWSVSSHSHRSLECPPEIQASLYRYAREGVPTGDFLRAVLCNDLMLAVQLADPVNYQHLFAICRFVIHHLPNGCWGSHLAVAAHLHKFATDDVPSNDNT